MEEKQALPPEKPDKSQKPIPPPPKKTSIFGEKDYVKKGVFASELSKQEHFTTLGIPKKERTEIGKILADKKIFGEIINKGEVWKVQSLIKELKSQGSSDNPAIKKVAKKIKETYGPYKARKIAEIIEEEFFGKK